MGCDACGGGCGTLTLGPVELALLNRLGETPFLPAASEYDRKAPVYLEEQAYRQEEYAAAILALAAKGLLQLDYDIPLERFDYKAYGAYPLHGSIALTGRRQEILEQIEIQGIEE